MIFVKKIGRNLKHSAECYAYENGAAVFSTSPQNRKKLVFADNLPATRLSTQRHTSISTKLTTTYEVLTANRLHRNFWWQKNSCSTPPYLGSRLLGSRLVKALSHHCENAAWIFAHNKRYKCGPFLPSSGYELRPKFHLARHDTTQLVESCRDVTSRELIPTWWTKKRWWSLVLFFCSGRTHPGYKKTITRSVGTRDYSTKTVFDTRQHVRRVFRHVRHDKTCCAQQHLTLGQHASARWRVVSSRMELGLTWKTATAKRQATRAIRVPNFSVNDTTTFPLLDGFKIFISRQVWECGIPQMAPKRTPNVKLKMSIIRVGQQLRNAVSMLLVPREQKRF